MKHITALFTFSLLLFTSSAAVPLRWTVETSRLAPAVFDVVRGETIALEAAFNSSGKPLAVDSEPVSIFWQTNGMGSAWWTAPAVATSNLVRATFTPEMDPGAATVNGFLGSSGSIYRAAFTFRFRHGPGAVPNTLPLPVPVIDFAKVRVLNPPWGGGGSGVDTNAVRDIIREQLAANGIRSVDGSARPLPKYLHALDFCDAYTNDAAWYYKQPQDYGSCSAVRDGGFLYRNYDWKFDYAAEFVVRMTAGPGRFASVGVANVGTNITEEMATSGKQLPPRYYKALPGRVVDGINENGVVAEVNVVDGEPQWGGGVSPALHPLAAVRWVLDHATNAQHGAAYLASHIAFPPGWTQNFHYMIADATSTYIVENGAAHLVDAESSPRAALTNFRLYPTRDTSGEGQERYDALMDGTNITSQWWTLTYTAAGYRPSDLPGITGEALTQLFDYWASKPRESHRGESFHSSTSTLNFNLTWWQTLHTSVYDITNRTLRIAVQETDDWYTFALPSAGTDEAKVREIAEGVVAPVASAVETHSSQLSQLSQTKADEFTEWTTDFPDFEVNSEIVFHDGMWYVVQKSNPEYYVGKGNKDSIRLVWGPGEWWESAEITATRKRVLRTGDAATPQEVAGKRDLTNNVCMEESFASWSFSDVSPGVSVPGQPYTYEDEFGGKHWVCSVIYDGYSDNAEAYGAGSGDLYATHLNFCNSDADIVGVKYTFTATRQRVATPYELFVTQSYVTNSITTLAPAPGNYAAVSNAAMNAIQAVTNADANLIFTITSDGAEPRFYFAPVGAIDPED